MHGVHLTPLAKSRSPGRAPSGGRTGGSPPGWAGGTPSPTPRGRAGAKRRARSERSRHHASPTPALLQHYGIDPAKIDGAAELLTAVPADVLLLDTTVRPDPGERPTQVQRVELPTYTSAPRSLVTENAMRRHGWVAARAGRLVESSKPLRADQITAARAAAAAAGLTIETRSGQDDHATLRTVTTTVGALLALAIVGMTIGLIRGEAAADLRTLTATGAAARTRRWVTASTAGALALLGVAISTAAAYVALVAAYHADLGQLAAPPIAHLLVLAVGLPAVAMTAGWLLAGREPATFSRQALV